MNIGIDGQVLEEPGYFGIKSYTINLLKNLATIDKSNKYYIYSMKNVQIPKRVNFKNVIIPKIIPILKRQSIAPYLMKNKNKLDIFHYPRPESSLNIPDIPSIITFHDPIPLAHRIKNDLSLKDKIDYLYINVFAQRNISKSNFFLCDSMATKKHVQNYLYMNGIVNKKLIDIPLSHNSKFRYRNKTNRNRKDFVCFTDSYNRKNTQSVVHAFSKFIKATKKKQKLNIVSSIQTQDDKLMDLITKLKLDNDVIIIKSPTTNQMVTLYNNSTALIYPSLFEGFGIPILEAFACGCPVITSNYGAMKEVAGNCALFVNPKSVNDIFNKLILISKERSLRNKLKVCGLERSKKFSWKKTASKTLEIYKKVATT